MQNGLIMGSMDTVVGRISFDAIHLIMRTGNSNVLHTETDILRLTFVVMANHTLFTLTDTTEGLHHEPKPIY